MKDPYQTLGVARGASQAEIKSAYRKLAKELHPDRHPNNPRMAERFKEVNAAYAIVGEEKQRARFDRGEIDEAGNERGPFAGYRAQPGGGAGSTEGFSFNFGGGGGQGGGGLDDIIADFFGGRGRGTGAGTAGSGGGARSRRETSIKGQHRRLKIEVGFEEAARGGTRRINLGDDGKALDVRIPAGIEDGQQIRLKGQGDIGMLGGEPGDALIEVKVAPHPWYTRKGKDVLIEVPVTLKEAVLGARITVPTLDGPVAVKVPKGASSGTVLRLRGKGIGDRTGTPGDQLMKLMVMLPAGDLTRVEKAVETLADDPAIRAKLGV